MRCCCCCYWLHVQNHAWNKREVKGQRSGEDGGVDDIKPNSPTTEAYPISVFNLARSLHDRYIGATGSPLLPSSFPFSSAIEHAVKVPP